MHEFKVNGITCGGCVNAIKKSISLIDEAAEITVNIETKKVRVESALPTQEILQQIAAAGYQVTESKNIQEGKK